MELFEDVEFNSFPTKYQAIINRVNNVKPVKYGKTRNFINGDVTYLSPYLSRGIISTKLVLNTVLNQGYNPKQIEKFIQELAWRDYWQQIWISKGTNINQDLKHTQKPVSHFNISKALVDAKTGIDAIDQAITKFYKTGYLHNHLRMYIASLACNVGHNHWKIPAKWMYYHLLDADWASNALSWQWVAGTNSNKKYIANQENINKYCFTNQKDTFLDVSYDRLSKIEIPTALQDVTNINLTTTLPQPKKIAVTPNLPTYIYNFYNLDPLWDQQIRANRILLLEPSHFKDYPVSKHSIDFILKFATQNIDNIQVYVGEFNTLAKTYNLTNINFKEHPLNTHYQGKETSRDWMFNVKGYYPSFFAFWKKCKKQLVY